MSFESNDMNTIHRGNYEEFFILYMDNELTDEQMNMVDEFLSAHPDLKAEFDLLMSTRLPLEEFSFDKKDLLAENMKLALVDEELLLYIDNELTADKKNSVGLKLASNKDYQLQYQALLQTRLDPSEKIPHPNKKELYRRTERVVSISIWMRVAAAAVIIVIGGLFYFKNASPEISTYNTPATAGIQPKVEKTPSKERVSEKPSPETRINNQLAITDPTKKGKKVKPSTVEQPEKKEESPVQQNLIAFTPPAIQEDNIVRPKVRSISTDGIDNGIALTKEPKVSVNKIPVTNTFAKRLDNSSGDDENLVASNDRKGSVRGFLRKATRMIEKRTGFDPTNDNGELLIGAVSINLK